MSEHNPWDVKSLQSCAIAAAVAYAIYHISSSWFTLRGLPVVGSPNVPLLSYVGAVRFLLNGTTLLREGYARHRGGIFKLATFDGWLVVLSGRELTEELRKLPDNVMSFGDALEQFLQVEYIMGRQFANDPFHVEVLRSTLPRKLDAVFSSVHNEIVAAMEDLLPQVCDDWTAVPAYSTTQKLIARASNRLLVGLPLCRDPEWMKLNIAFTMNWVIGAQLLRPFPDVLKRTVSKYVSPVPAKLQRGREILGPVIEDFKTRLAALEPDHPERPDVFLAWIIESAKSDPWRTSLEGLTNFIMAMNFASIDTTSIMCTNALYDLAAHPEYIAPLRAEAEAVVAEHGWTKAAMGELHKLDSFIRESHRIWAALMSMTRVAKVPHTFSNGVTIPKGTTITISSVVHADDEVYPDADKFQPFRHIEGANRDVEPARRQFVSPSAEYLPFGLGKHACPGRFFAANEVKAIIALIVMQYDIRTEVEGVRPPPLIIGAQQIPNRSATILFRKRRA